ncbi:MAG: hypothetical protein ABH878_08695, partial [bacterium]
MKTLIYTIIALILLFANAFALNQMTLVGQYDGENSDDLFGQCMTMGDFDNDGHDEFFISALRWNNLRGKNYYYDWNGNWPTAPDWTFQGTEDLHIYDWVDQNMGDINLDGIEDFGVAEIRAGEPTRLDLLFGSTAFDSVADWSMWTESPAATCTMLDSCGDINADGGLDFIMHIISNYPDYEDVRIYYGGEILDSIPDWFFPIPDFEYQFCHGLGDVNGDG